MDLETITVYDIQEENLPEVQKSILMLPTGTLNEQQYKRENYHLRVTTSQEHRNSKQKTVINPPDATQIRIIDRLNIPKNSEMIDIDIVNKTASFTYENRDYVVRKVNYVKVK